MTGRGAGLSSAGLSKKVEVIKRAVSLHRPDKTDALDVLSKVGGFDLAGMAGVFLGGAALHMPVIIDGFTPVWRRLSATELPVPAGKRIHAGFP